MVFRGLHLHSDHIDGLGELMLQYWAGAREPLPIAGPGRGRGCRGGVADTITPGAALGEWIGAKLTVLTNIVPAAPNRLAERLFLGDAKVDIGEEGMVISFP